MRWDVFRYNARNSPGILIGLVVTALVVLAFIGATAAAGRIDQAIAFMVLGGFPVWIMWRVMLNPNLGGDGPPPPWEVHDQSTKNAE